MSDATAHDRKEGEKEAPPDTSGVPAPSQDLGNGGQEIPDVAEANQLKSNGTGEAEDAQTPVNGARDHGNGVMGSGGDEGAKQKGEEAKREEEERQKEEERKRVEEEERQKEEERKRVEEEERQTEERKRVEEEERRKEEERKRVEEEERQKEEERKRVEEEEKQKEEERKRVEEEERQKEEERKRVEEEERQKEEERKRVEEEEKQKEEERKRVGEEEKQKEEERKRVEEEEKQKEEERKRVEEEEKQKEEERKRVEEEERQKEEERKRVEEEEKQKEKERKKMEEKERQKEEERKREEEDRQQEEKKKKIEEEAEKMRQQEEEKKRVEVESEKKEDIIGVEAEEIQREGEKSGAAEKADKKKEVADETDGERHEPTLSQRKIADNDGRGETQDKAGAESPPNRSSTAMNVFAVTVVALIAVCFIQVIKAPASDSSQSDCAFRKRSQRDEALSRGMTSLRERFPTLDESVWETVAGASRAHVTDQQKITGPVVLLLAGQVGKADVVSDVAAGVADMYADVYSEARAENDVTRIAGKNLKSTPADKAKRELHTVIDAGFEECARVTLVTDFDKLPPCASILFHGYCDNDNAPVKDAVFVFTMTLKRKTSSDVSVADVEGQLREQWSRCADEFPPDKLTAMLSRVENNVVIIN